MCVNLGGGDFLMSQHALDSPQVGPSLKKVGGKGVTESMRTYRFGNSRHCGKILYNIKDHDPGQGTASSYAKEEIGLRTRFDIDMASVLKVVVYLVDGPVRYGNQTLFAAFTGNPYETFIQEQVLHLEGTEFRYAQAAAVHGLYHGLVTLALRRGEVYLTDDAVNL